MIQVYVIVTLILLVIYLIYKRIDFENLDPEQQICMGCHMEFGGCPLEATVLDPTRVCRLLGSDAPKDTI